MIITDKEGIFVTTEQRDSVTVEETTNATLPVSAIIAKPMRDLFKRQEFRWFLVVHG